MTLKQYQDGRVLSLSSLAIRYYTKTQVGGGIILICEG